MSPKISLGLLLRLAVLLAAFLAQTSEGATFRDFRTRHIDFPKTRAGNNNAYCNLMMTRRGLTRGACKPTNTFINANQNRIKEVCHRGGRRVNRNVFESRRRFRVITCRNRGRYPNCNYVARRETKRIRVGCVNRLPVHFDRLV